MLPTALFLVACALITKSDLDARLDLDGDGVPRPTDCDDDDAQVTERTWQSDADGDGFGGDQTLTECAPGEGWVLDRGDCDDADASVNPDADEVCNERDDDCDGLADDGVTVPTWYEDEDGDGYGSETATDACVQPAGYVAEPGDCDDADYDTNPGITWYRDADGDAYGDPGATTTHCGQPDGYLSDSSDCDDSRADVSPSGAEVCDADDADEDCDGAADDADPSAVGQSTWYADTDADSFGDAFATTLACDQPAGFVADLADCDDSDASVTDTDCAWTSVEASTYYTCGIRGNGTLECWGGGYVTPLLATGPFLEVASSYWNACALDTGGGVTCWGYDGHGVVSTAPTATGFTDVAVGTDFACALDPTGEVTCWGEDNYGQATPSPGPFVAIGTADRTGYGLDASGAITNWGGNYPPPSGVYASMGIGDWIACAVTAAGHVDCTTAGGTSTSELHAPPYEDYVKVSGGGYYYASCGLRSTGELSCWGRDSFGETAAPSGTYTDVSLGYSHACATDSSGAIVCWGDCGSGDCDVPE